MNKRYSRLIRSSLVMIAIILMIGTFAFVSLDQSALQQSAGAAGVSGTLLSSGKGVVLGSNAISTEAQTPDGSAVDQTGRFNGVDIYTTNSSGGEYDANRTELVFKPAASGNSIASKILFNTTNDNYLQNNFYNAMLGGVSGDFLTYAELNFNISVASGGSVPVIVTFAWSPNGSTEQTSIIGDDPESPVIIDSSNYPVQMLFADNLISTGLNQNAYFRIEIKIMGTGSEVRVSNFVIDTSTTLASDIILAPTSIFEIEGTNKENVWLNTLNKSTNNYVNQLNGAYVKAGDFITVRAKVYADSITSTCFELPSVYRKVFGSDGEYGVYWQQYSSSINIDTGLPEDNLNLRYLTIDATKSGYKQVTENGVTSWYYQVVFQVNSGVRNVYQLVIEPQLLVHYDKDGASSIRGVASTNQEPIRIKVDGTAPSAPVIDESSALGIAIANGTWYIDSYTVSLSYAASSVAVQAKEYIYAYVIEDPALLSINYSNLNFKPYLTDPLGYINSAFESKESGTRQELIYYEPVVGSPGLYTQKSRAITFHNSKEQALVLFRIDAAGNVSVPKIYYAAESNSIKVDSASYSVGTSFLIGDDAQELAGNNHTKAAYRECFWGPTYHNADGTFKGVSSYGYISDKDSNMYFKRGQWMTIRISVTSTQAAAYKLIRYKNEEAGFNEYNNNGIVFTPGPTGRPAYIDVTFQLTDDFIEGTKIFFFYFRKSLNITVTDLSFVFNGRSQGLEDYLEAYNGTTMITGLTFDTLYYETVVYSVEPDYVGEDMQPSGSIVIGTVRYNYTGMLEVGNTIEIAGLGGYHVLQRVKSVVEGQIKYQTTFFIEEGGLANGLIDVGQYYYSININVASTTLYFGIKTGFYTITRADPEVTGLAGSDIVFEQSLDELTFSSLDEYGVVINNAFFNIGGIDYFKTKSGVLGTYEIVFPTSGSINFTNPNVSANMRVEVRFNPIPLSDTAVFTQEIIAQNYDTYLKDYFDYANGLYFLKKGAYHSGNFASTTQTIYIKVINALASLDIQGISINQIILDYDGTYKSLVFITNPGDLPVKFYFNPYVGGSVNPNTVYNNINNAGTYQITYYIDSAACNYMSGDLYATVIIEKRELILVPVGFNSIASETHAGKEFDKYYSIKYGKITSTLLPKPTANIRDGGTVNVAYVYSYMIVKDYSGVTVPDPVYSEDYMGASFPKDLDVGTYALRISVNDANNEGYSYVLLVIDKALLSDINQATPRLNSDYAVYNKDGSLQSYLGDATQGHIEYGQTLEARATYLLAGVANTAIYVLAGTTTTIGGRFIFETEFDIRARYDQLYATEPSRMFTLQQDYLGRSILPVRYDAFDNKIVSNYTIILYWEAGEWQGDEFVSNTNFDLMQYSVSLVVARATADLSFMSFQKIIYGEAFGATHTLLGKPVSSATGSPSTGNPNSGFSSETYTISYDASLKDVLFTKGLHDISCTFVPVDQNNYRTLTNVKIPLTVEAKEMFVELGTGILKELTFGAIYIVPECRIYSLNELNERLYYQGVVANILEYVYTRNNQVVNISTNLGMITYVSAVPASDYTLTVTITSNDYMGFEVFNDFVIHKGSLEEISKPTQEIVEYGVLIGDIDFYNGQVQNRNIGAAYSGVFRMISNAGDATFVPEADREGYSVSRWLLFYPADASLYNYYEEYTLEWKYEINKNSKDVSIVPVADTLNVVYDGTPRPADYNVSYPGTEVIKNYTTVSYTSLDGQIIYTNVPRDAGSYKVTITVNDSFDNYSGTLTTTLVIAKQTINIIFAERYYSYNGQNQGFGSLDFGNYVGDEGLIKYVIQYNRYTGVSMFEQIPSDVGKYIARITINENNYQGTANINYYIIPTSVTVTGWNYIFDDTQKQIGVEVLPSNVSYSVKYRAEQRDDENNLIGTFSEAKPNDAGRYQVRITVNENGYYKEIDVFSGVEANGNLYDASVNLIIAQAYAGEYADKIAEAPLTGSYPLFMRIFKTYALMTVPAGSQNKSVVYNGSGYSIIPVFNPSYLTASYLYTPCEFILVDGMVIPTLVGGVPIPLADTSAIVFDSYNRPVSVGYYVLTISLNDKDYELGSYVKPTLKINPATLIIDTMPAVSGTVYYKQTEPVSFISGTGQVRFVALGTTVSGRWEIVSDISSLKVGSYGNITVRFVPIKNNGTVNNDYVQPTGSITLTISKKEIGEYIYFTNNGVPLAWADGVEIHKDYTQLQLSCSAWLDAAAAGIDSTYNNGKPMTIRIKYNGTYTLPTNVGTYVVVAEISDANYQGQSLSGTLVIDRAQPKIHAPVASAIPVGSTLSASRLTSGLAYIAGSEEENQLRSIAGTFTFRDPDTLMGKANYHKVWVVFTPASLSTYDVALFQIDIRVLGIDVSVAGVSATAISYGEPLSRSVLTYTTSTVPGHIRWSDSTEIIDVGAQAGYMFVPDNTDVYNIIYDGRISIDIAIAEMNYNPETLLIKGYVGETIGQAINNISIELWHSLYPGLSVEGASFSIYDLNNGLSLNTLIEYSKLTYSCRLVVTHPNYQPMQISTQIRTYIFLGSDNFYVADKSKDYDAEAVTIENLNIVLVGTEEQLDLAIFRMNVYKNGIRVSEMRDPGTYTVEISLLDDTFDEETSMTYDGHCEFEYIINKKDFDGGQSAESNLLYITGNSTAYGNTAGDMSVYYQYKKYRFNIAQAGKVYDGIPLSIAYLGITLLGTDDILSYDITRIQRLNTATSVYETVLSATMPGTYRVTVSAVQNTAMGIGNAPGAAVVIPFIIYSSAPQGGIAADTNVYGFAVYYPADETEVRLTYFSEDKNIEYGESAPVSAGSYIVRVTFLSTNPYYKGSQEFPYTVSAMDIYVSLESAYNFEYGATIVINPMFTATPGSQNAMSNIGYAIQYYISNGSNWMLLNNTPVNAGNYMAKIVLTGTDYVLASGQGEVRMDITKLKVNIISMPTISNLYFGQELYNAVIAIPVNNDNAVAVLDKNGAPVTGDFFFKDPDKNDLSAGDRSVTLVFVPTNPNYAEAEISGVPIKILKAAASIECLQLTLPYNGLEQQPVVRTNPVTNLTVTFSYYQYINGLRQGVNKPKFAGTYEVDMKISDGNYEGTANGVSFTITKAVISDADVVVPNIGALTYGQSLSYGAFVGGSATNPANGSDVAGVFRFTYSGLTLLGTSVEQGGISDNSNPYTFVPYVPANGEISDILGVYETMPYRFVPLDTANYEYYESTIAVTLMKASASITVNDGTVASFVYGDKLPMLTFKTSPLGLTVSNDAYMAETGIFNTAPSAGTYMFTAKINDTNYAGELVYIVSVNKRKAQVEFFDEDNQITTWYSYTFSQTQAARAKLMTASVLPQDVQRISEIEVGLSYRYIKRDNSSITMWRKVPDNVGEYTVYAVLENSDYYIDSETVRPNYDITKATVEYLDFDSSTLINLVYGKAPIPTVVTRPNNIAYTISFPGYESMPTTAGAHRIKVVVNDQNYYPTEKTSMFYIYKKDINIDNIQVVDRPYDGTDVIQISGTLTGLVVGNEVRLTMTARTKDGVTEPGVYSVEILSWEITGLHASNYNVIAPVFNGMVKINQKVITDPKTSSYITCGEGFTSNITVSFENVYSKQNKSNFFSSLFGQTAIVQAFSIKELGSNKVLDKKVKFHVLIPEKYRNSSTLQVEGLDDLTIENPTREGDYMTFYANSSGEIVFYTNDFPYWIIVVGGGILMVIIGGILLFSMAPVRRRKKIPGMARYVYGAGQNAAAKAAQRGATMSAMARRGRVFR